MFSITGNTILITGGGSGIGRALAEAFHAKGNKVIITGRNASKLSAVEKANPGIVSRELDVDDPARINAFAQEIVATVQLIELVPPYVQTELMGPAQAVDPNAMPVADYISETMRLLEAGPVPKEFSLSEPCSSFRPSATTATHRPSTSSTTDQFGAGERLFAVSLSNIRTVSDTLTKVIWRRRWAGFSADA